jgi:hypothetical protein
MSNEALGLNRNLRVGLAAGLLMNVLGWIGNQLILGTLWTDAIQDVVPLRSRTWVNELVSLVPDFMYGIANSALLPVELAVATTLVGLASAVPTAWFVWKGLHRQAAGFE